MKVMTLIGVIILMFSSVASGAGFEMSNQVEEYTVNIMIDKNPPSVGPNIMEIFITGEKGSPVKDIKVAVDYGKGKKAYGAALLRHGPGYHTELDFSTKGRWFVNVRITKQEKTVSTKFTFDVK